MSDALHSYGRALVDVETRPHQDNERRELEAEVRVRREREKQLKAKIGELERKVISLSRRVTGRVSA